ncbi:hypothetical protein MHTCC0001_22880 [Flavobacteriaceae bacterium MHTCC 0001]
MRLISVFREIKSKDVTFLLLLGVVSSFPLVKVNPIFIFALITLQTGFIIYNRSLEFKVSNFFWFLMILFALNFLGLLYSENISRGTTIITRQVSFLLFPLFYITYRIKNITLLLKTYVVAIFAFTMVFEIHTLYRFFFQSNVFPLNLKLFLSFRHTGAELTKLIEIHNAYFGMYIMFSNVIIISFLKKTQNSYKLILLLLLLAFQSLFILQMVAKTAIIINSSIIFFSLFYFSVRQKKMKTICFLLLLTLVLGWFAKNHLNLPFQRIAERFVELKAGDNTIRETRIKIWKSAVPIVKKHYLVGVGTGDVENELHKEYEKRNISSRSNIHNQYLDYLIRFGCVGLFFFLFVLGFALRRAIKMKNYIYFCFTIIIMGCCFTENILSRQWGITFFACFNYILYIQKK